MISIIIPMYNSEKYISTLLDSLYSQIHKDFEVIIVNDGSSDNSRKIVLDYIKECTFKINLIDIDNSGVSVARNVGLKNAKGEFVTFVDADDILLPHFLDLQYKLIKKHNVDMSYIDHISFSGSSNYQCKLNKNLSVKKYSNQEFFYDYAYKKTSPGIWSFLIKKEFLHSYNILFKVGYKYSEDMEFIYNISINNPKILHIKSKQYLYRIHENSAMSQISARRVDGFNLLKLFSVFLKENKHDLSIPFDRIAIPRWVWSTLRQFAMSSDNFDDFNKYSKLIESRINMKQLLFTKGFIVSIFAFIYIISPKLFYFLIKRISRIKDKRKYNKVGIL